MKHHTFHALRRTQVLALLSCAFLAAATAGCATTMTNSTVRGTATYLERMLLRPDSVLEVAVVDASRADASAESIGSVRIENPGAPPFRFEIPIDASAIDERRSYVARATIRTGGELLMSADTPYPVLTRGAGNDVEMLLRRVPRTSAGPLDPLPATFTGVLPCADCPGIDYHLDVFSDSVFYLKRTYLGRGLTIDDIGSWTAPPQAAMLGIWGDGEAPTELRIVDADTLRLLDRNGGDIESSLNYNLRRAATFAPAELALSLHGVYQYMADAGIFAECQSGRRFAVAQEDDNAALERAYLAARRQPGDALLASFDGRIVMRPPIEGQGLRPTVIVERFTGVWPAETCGARMSTSELLDTNWVLTRLGNEPVGGAENARQARLVLRSDGNRATGFGGCNDFTGAFEITGRTIAFSQMATTMRACLAGSDTERAFLAALGAATTFRQMRHHLELYDAAGALLARLEARELG